MEQPRPAGPYLRCDEAASLLRVSPKTLRNWRHEGKGPRSIKIGGRVLWSQPAVMAYLANAEGVGADVPPDMASPTLGRMDLQALITAQRAALSDVEVALTAALREHPGAFDSPDHDVARRVAQVRADLGRVRTTQYWDAARGNTVRWDTASGAWVEAPSSPV